MTENGYYENGLPWKPPHPPIPGTESLIRVPLNTLTKRLAKIEKMQEDHQVKTKKIANGILEPKQPTSAVVHHIWHHSTSRG